MRRCAGCMESKPQSEMTRIAYFEGQLSVDLTGRAKGRGVYLCQNKTCIENAKKKRALNRSFRTDLPKEDLETVFAQLEGALEHVQE